MLFEFIISIEPIKFTIDINPPFLISSSKKKESHIKNISNN